MKLMTAYLAAILSMGVMAKADEVPVAAPTATEAVKCEKECNEGVFPFALDFSVEGEYFAFDNEITAVTPTLEMGVTDSLSFSAALPIYNDSAETGLSDINFGANYELLNGECGLFNFLGKNCASLGVNAVLGVPLDGYFSSDNATFTVGGDFGLKFGSFNFTQDVNYLFADGAVYTPDFGGFVNENILSADTVLSYSVTESISVGAKFSQDYCDDSQILTLGPVADWAFAKGAGLNLGIGFPISQEDMPYGESDFTLTAGLGFKF